MVPKIIEHMNTMPYQGGGGRVYKYGEFFPIELSPFPYNGSVAQEYYPFSKEQLLKNDFNYREPEEKHPHIDLKAAEIPDDSALVGDDILGKTIECEHAGNCVHQCSAAFRLTPQELVFYKRAKLPIPHQCPNCRHYERLQWRNPWKLWHRQCMCELKHAHHTGACANEFETSYAPERPEKIYCEACYNAEVV